MLIEPHAERLDAWLDPGAELVECRLVERLPVAMTIGDNACALISSSGVGAESGGVIFEQSSAVAALRELFDLEWQSARRLGPREACAETSAEAPTRSMDAVRLAELLAAGASDDAIARRMGISVRTLTRLIGQLRDDLGAKSRFQAGVLAERGLLGGTHDAD